MRFPGIPILALAVLASVVAAPAASTAAPGPAPAAPPVIRAEDVPAGYDLFETDPQSTTVTFEEVSKLPAGFFATGSLEFTGTVKLCGEPLDTVAPSGGLGDTDTIVQRLGDISIGPGGSTTVPIEIVGLNLVGCEPINVSVGGTIQKWEVKVEPSPTTESQGVMTINRSTDSGGTFTSQLQILPLFTFTRPSGKTRTLDAGDSTSTPWLAPTERTELLDGFVTHSASAPWSDGCELPALAVRGVNDGFCPGLNKRRRKRVVEKVGMLFEQSVVPAQPRLEHFACYGADERREEFKPRRVRFKDQFGKRSGRILRPVDLCNPAKKKSEPLLQKRVHLKCYAFDGGKFKRRIAVTRDQFGSRRLSVKEPVKVCVPSLKQLLQPSEKMTVDGQPNPRLVDSFVCYRVKQRGESRARSVRVKDQFGRFRTRVLEPVELCAPARVDGVASNHAIQHLTCYRLDLKHPADFERRLVQVSNRYGREALSVRRPGQLCVPGAKVLP